MPFLIIGAAVLLLVLIVLGVARWSFGKAFYMPAKKKKVDPHLFFGNERDMQYKEPMMKWVRDVEGRPYERIEITSRDGLRLVGRFYPAKNSDNRVEIFFHGWRGAALRDGCGAAGLTQKSGVNLILVDQRAHGESDGNVITFGIKEKYDCLDWINYAVERFGSDVKIMLSGVSMGASTVLMASELDLPPQVKGISADCGYSSPESIIRKVCRDMGISDKIGYPFVCLAARLFGGFSMKDGGAVEAVKHAKVPILIIHGEEDDFVPFSMAKEIYDACASEKYYLAVKDAGHGLSFFCDFDTYEALEREFQARIYRD